MEHRINYFAYGSNLHPERLRARVSTFDLVCCGRVHGFDLRFHKRGRDGSAKCDAYYTGDAGQSVLGAVYAISADARRKLDEIEDLGCGYERQKVDVVCKSGQIEAYTYVAEPHFIDRTVKPFSWYKQYVLEGARHWQFDSRYISAIEQVDAETDQNRERNLYNGEILGRNKNLRE